MVPTPGAVQFAGEAAAGDAADLVPACATMLVLLVDRIVYTCSISRRPLIALRVEMHPQRVVNATAEP